MKRPHPTLKIAFVAVAVWTIGRATPGARAAPPEAAADCGTDNLLAGKLPRHQLDVEGDPHLVTDGTIVPEGATWDGPSGVKLGSRAASLTYDLGRPRAVGALYLQADANDTYTIAGSLDDRLDDFKTIAQAADVVDRGHGMRGRALRIAPMTVRYLRIGEANGDGYYSVSELAAYCRAPTPFPPAMPVLEAPMAVGPLPADDRPSAEVGHLVTTRLGPFERFLLAAIVLLGGAILLGRQSGAAPADGRAPDERAFPLLFALFMVSGAAALIYEVIWFQMLQLVLGSSAISIGVLLGTFMGGMCLGSLSLARFVSPRRHPLRIYALLEVAVGVSGILMLVAMPLIEKVYTQVVGHGVPGLLLRGFFAALCLLPPTVMMGATLPAVARWIRTTPRGVSRLGYLYAANTTGAVLGCLFAGFYLLRVYNVSTATFVAVLLNAIGAAGAFTLAGKRPHLDAGAAPTERAPLGAPPILKTAWIVYVVICLSGVTALGAEVIWTRLFALLLGATTYTFSLILAVFLIGIGIGSSSASALMRRIPNPLRALGFVQLLLIAAIAWTAWNITSALPYWPVDPKLASGPFYQFQIDFVRCLWAILPAACLWGASFPLALGAVASETDDGGRVVGRIYAANTVGAIIGSLTMSLVIVVAFGTQNGERILIVLAALAALVALLPLGALAGAGGPRRPLTIRDALWVVVILEIAAVAARNVAPIPAFLIGHGRTAASNVHEKVRYLYVGEGLNSSPAVSRDQNGIVSYHNAGKVQASSTPADMRLQRMLGHLTTLVPEHPRSVLVVACGAGVTAGAASIDPRVEQLTMAEIEPLVPKAASEYFGDYNFNVVKNPKVRIELDDARHFLNTTKEKFDAITSDPFDPWVKGAANLYTKEFWEMTKRHLNPGGVVTAWVELYESGLAATKSEIATFFQAFPNATIWGNPIAGIGYDTVLLGQAEPTTIDVDRMQSLLASAELAPVARSLRQIGFNSAIDLLATYAGREAELRPWLQDAEINRDDNLRLQFLAGFDLNLDQREQTYREILSYRQYPSDLFTGAPSTLATLRTAIFAKR